MNVPRPFCRTASLSVLLIVCDQLLDALVADGDGCDETDDVTSGSGSVVSTAEYCFRFRRKPLTEPPRGRHRQYSSDRAAARRMITPSDTLSRA